MTDTPRARPWSDSQGLWLSSKGLYTEVHPLPTVLPTFSKYALNLPKIPFLHQPLQGSNVPALF